MADDQRHLSSDPSVAPPSAEPRLDGRVDGGERRETAARLLRRTREMHGQDLAGIADALRIRHAYLSAIERGAFDELPGATYAVGFVRSYAAFLGLDEEDVVRRFKEDVAGLERTQELHFPEPVNEGKVPGGAVILISLVLLAVAYGGWYVLTSPGTSLSEMAPRVPERLQALVGGGENPASAPETGSPPPAAETSQPAPSDPTTTQTAETGEGSIAQPADTGASARTATGGAGGEASGESGGGAPDGQQTAAAEAVQDESAADTGNGAGTSATARPEPPGTPGQGTAATGTGSASTPDAPDTGAASAADTGAVDDDTGDGSVTVGEQTVELPGATGDTAAANPAAETGGTASAGETGAGASGTPSASTPDAPTQTDGSRTGSSDTGGVQTADTGSQGGGVDAGETTSGEAAQRAADGASPDRTGGQGAPPVPGTENEDGAGDTQTASAPSGRVFGAASGEAALVLRATADSWVQVRGPNDDILISRVLEPGDIYRVPKRDGLRLHTGNAGGLTVEVDGRSVRTLGEPGEVRRNIALTPANLLDGG